MTFSINDDNFFADKFGSQAIAVIDDTGQWSYDQFATCVHQLRDYFIDNHIRTVAFRLNQGFYAYAVEWAAFLAGTTFCPLNVNDPQPRIDKVLKVLQPQLLISDSPQNSEFHTLTIAELMTIFASQYTDDTALARFREPADNPTAYVIFTSGTTGTPKGVAIKRTALKNLMAWSVSATGAVPGDRWAQYSILAFDFSIADVFPAIYAGATLVSFVQPQDKLMPGFLIKQHGITIWQSVPSVIDLMTRARQLSADCLSGIKLMLFCGEKLFPTHLEKLFEVNPQLKVINAYGPTETTVFCAAQICDASNYKQFCRSTVAIGQALPGFELLIENPQDAIGELVVKSEFISSGYINREPDGVTGFKSLQIAGDTHEVYATGDYVFEAEDGVLYFDRRVDSQTKVSGFRVDLGEIDSNLLALGCTQSCSVCIDNQIIAFVAAQGKEQEALKNQLRELIPYYFVPTRIEIYDAVPLTANGKVDTKTLIASLT